MPPATSASCWAFLPRIASAGFAAPGARDQATLAVVGTGKENEVLFVAIDPEP